MLQSKNIALDDAHLKVCRKYEYSAILFNFFSIFLPFGLLHITFHPLEPTHRLISDWLEIDFSPSLILLPWIILFMVGIMGAANILIVMGYTALCYCVITTTVLKDLTPRRIPTGVNHRLRFSLETSFYGILEDFEILQMYRELRLYNLLLNDILATFWFSIHQVGCLTTFTVLLYFGVKFNHVVLGYGLVGILVVGGSFFAPIAVVWYQSDMFGELAETSDQFKVEGRNVIPTRKSLYTKFVRSCQTFYVEEAYPFYKIGRNTFLLFCAQGLDHAISLLLWQR